MTKYRQKGASDKSGQYSLKSLGDSRINQWVARIETVGAAQEIECFKFPPRKYTYLL